MFKDPDLQDYIQKTSTLNIQSLIIAEWNLNDFSNIDKIGVYKYRPDINFDESIDYKQYPQGPKDLRFLPIDYDSNNIANFYIEYDDLNYIGQDRVVENDPSLFFTTAEKQRGLYFDLKQCFEPFRPRSGINKILFLNNKYVDNIKSAKRPRYYVASKYDKFKYWTSYRVENDFYNKNIVGLSYPFNKNEEVGYTIFDAVPFVTYKEPIPINNIVVKMQTNLSEDSGEIIRLPNGEKIIDPLTDRSKSSIPKRWSIEYLTQENTWEKAISFNEYDLRRDGSPIVGADGYVEVSYGLKVPERFKLSFEFVDYLLDESLLPNSPLDGESYIIGASETNAGTIYIWDSITFDWVVSTPEYGFSLVEDDDTKKINILKSLVDPDYFIVEGKRIFRDISIIKGMRVVVTTMIAPETTFDLIELSPRIKADISNYTTDFSITKTIARNGEGVPVGGMLASNGDISIMNFDASFSEQNVFDIETGTGSLVAKYLDPNTKISIYESVLRVKDSVDNLFYDKFIPIKTMYVESFPKSEGGMKDLTIKLRDNTFRLETSQAQTLFLKNVTLTAAVAVLLDNIGFSNYIFKNNINGEVYDPIIPYFFVQPDLSVAEVLDQLATAFQAAIFFDEFNNLVIMSKEYLIPDYQNRSEDIVLYGQYTDENLPNIESIENSETNIVNDGVINYTIRYIQRSAASLRQAQLLDQDVTYIYKPTLLWEVSGTEQRQTKNENASLSQGYTLGAVSLSSDLTDSPPIVENGELVNNIIDIGESIFWLPRFSGFLYANGEIIRYDAIEYTISGGVSIEESIIQPPVPIPPEEDNQSLPIGENPVYSNIFQRIQRPSIRGILPKPKERPLIGIKKTFAEKILEQQNDGPILNQSEYTYITPNKKTRIRPDYTSITRTRNVSTVWIKNNEEYQKYFSQLPFNGKMYATGNVRIYSEPYYDNLDNSESRELSNFQPRNGEVKSHGRGQFNTPIVYHSAGLNSYWTNNANVRGVKMDSRYLFNTTPTDKIAYPTFTKISTDASIVLDKDLPVIGNDQSTANKSFRTGIIANFMRENIRSDDELKTLDTKSTGVIQSSALSFTGANPMPASINKKDFITYAFKEFDNSYSHYGTRMRIIGKSESTDGQNPENSGEYFTVPSLSGNENVVLNGGSGGIGIFTNKNKNYGYFFEIASLTKNNLDQYQKLNQDTKEEESVLHNIMFYKLVPGPGEEISTTTVTVPGFSGSGIYLDLSSFSSTSTVPVTISVSQESSVFHFINIPGIANIPENWGTRVVNLQGGRIYGPCSAPNGGLYIGNENIGVRGSGSLPNTTLVVEEGGDDWNDMVLRVNQGFFRRLTAAPTTTQTVFLRKQPEAIPVKLWGGMGEILVDSGNFVGMDRVAQSKPTVYDLAVEYEKINSTTKRFYLYINNTLISIVDDKNSLVDTKTSCLFVRGSSKVMFENFYALNNLQSKSTATAIVKNINEAFSTEDITSSDFLRKYALSGFVSKSYLSNINLDSQPKYNIYFEEFGTILRECSYFNIRYDKAYPAFLAQIVPTLNKEKGYVVSGFRPYSYGAEFLIFNATDKALNLDETSGNYLKINGVTFTQNTTRDLTVDEYFQERSNPLGFLSSSNTLTSFSEQKEVFDNIKNSRSKYGKRSFSLNSLYIQTDDVANNLMSWIISKTIRPRKIINMNVFGVPHLQLGDIVKINYVLPEGYDFVNSETKFLVDSISYNKEGNELYTNIRVSEI